MINFRSFFCLLLIVSFVGTSGISKLVYGQSPKRDDEFASGINQVRNTWNRLEKDGPWDSYGVRNPADHLFMLCAARIERPNLDVPMDLAAGLLDKIRAMQDLAVGSNTFGNFRWYWRQDRVQDQNAVEFVSQRLLYCWNHRNVLPEDAQKRLDTILKDCCDGCLKHGVPSKYTNIAIVNAVNLILLGEQFNRPDALSEGRLRFEKFLYWTHQNGITEFSSPTYYGVALEGLDLLLAASQDDSIRQSAQGLADFFALEIAAHWRFGQFVGACSRTYNYRYGDPWLDYVVSGWNWQELPTVYNSPLSRISIDIQKYKPCSLVESTFRSSLPRLVRQRWGREDGQWKTAYLTDNWGIGISANPYLARQETLWAVNLPKRSGEPNPRCYFIPDSRLDPYGVKKIETGGGHNKALHLRCAWRAVQENNRTLAVVAYPEELLTPETYNGEEIRSVFVFKKPDETRHDAPHRLALRWGRTVLRIEIIDGVYDRIDPPTGEMADDPCVCWTIWHGKKAESEPVSESVSESGTRTISGTGLESTSEKSKTPRLSFVSEIFDLPSDAPESIPEFREPLSVSVESNAIRWGALALAFPDLTDFSELSLGTKTLFSPEPPQDILEINGQGLGRSFLVDHAPALRIILDQMSANKPQAPPKVALNLGETFSWKATDGLFYPAYRQDDGALRINDQVEYQLEIENSGEYTLSAKVLAVDPQHDSLMIRWISPAGEEPNAAWHLNSSKDWRTVELRLQDQKSATKILSLPAGSFRLFLSPREFNVQVKEWELKRVR